MTTLPIPVHLFTGPLGVGKTTALGRLLANKPAQESWLVVMNEFTESGIDALTLGAQANGAYDLRLIPGGCLCCTGEADFRQQLSAVLAGDPASWPTRMVIEQSGVGHPGAVVNELRLFERSGALQLVSTIALVDWPRIAEPQSMDDLTNAQVTMADVLVLAKADQVDAVAQTRFLAWANDLFPPKRWVGISEHGLLPIEALAPPQAAFEFERTLTRPAHHVAHEQEAQRLTEHAMWLGVVVTRTEHDLLQRHACGWRVSADLLFDAMQLQARVNSLADASHLERFKAVLRTDVNQWQLLQCWRDQHGLHWSGSSLPEAQENRLEAQLSVGTSTQWTEWDAVLASCVNRCPVG